MRLIVTQEVAGSRPARGANNRVNERRFKMTRSSIKRTQQLGMPYGTACGRLRKQLMFALLQRLDAAKCFRCGEEIESAATLSVEHKTPWLDSDDPSGLFFDLDNIAFSHLVCNSRAARRPTKRRLSPEACRETDRKRWRENKRRNYSKEARAKKYRKTGY